jgi:hypothetical protein
MGETPLHLAAESAANGRDSADLVQFLVERSVEFEHLDSSPPAERL